MFLFGKLHQREHRVGEKSGDLRSTVAIGYMQLVASKIKIFMTKQTQYVQTLHLLGTRQTSQ